MEGVGGGAKAGRWEVWRWILLTAVLLKLFLHHLLKKKTHLHVHARARTHTHTHTSTYSNRTLHEATLVVCYAA